MLAWRSLSKVNKEISFVDAVSKDVTNRRRQSNQSGEKINEGTKDIIMRMENESINIDSKF